MARRFALKDFAYAHRGLWTNDGLPENSLASFRAAAEAGLGIEFDLRPSADGEVMVFHDPLLERMTGATGEVETLPASALGAYRLKGGSEPLPSFEDLLSLWPQDLPMLAEMKIDGSTDAGAFAAKVGARLMDWPGLAAAMSFSDIAVRALPEGLMRGQLIGPACIWAKPISIPSLSAPSPMASITSPSTTQTPPAPPLQQPAKTCHSPCGRCAQRPIWLRWSPTIRP